MSLKQLQEDLNKALKNGEALKVSVLRLLLSALNYEKIDKQKELNEEEIINVIKYEAKKRRESIELYAKGKREDLVNKEKSELDILLTYLPKEMSEAEISEKVKNIIAALSPEEKQNFGQVMGKVMGELKGKADGGLIAKLVKENVG